MSEPLLVVEGLKTRARVVIAADLFETELMALGVMVLDTLADRGVDPKTFYEFWRDNKSCLPGKKRMQPTRNGKWKTVKGA